MYNKYKKNINTTQFLRIFDGPFVSYESLGKNRTLISLIPADYFDCLTGSLAGSDMPDYLDFISVIYVISGLPWE